MRLKIVKSTRNTEEQTTIDPDERLIESLNPTLKKFCKTFYKKHINLAKKKYLRQSTWSQTCRYSTQSKGEHRRRESTNQHRVKSRQMQLGNDLSLRSRITKTFPDRVEPKLPHPTGLCNQIIPPGHRSRHLWKHTDRTKVIITEKWILLEVETRVRSDNQSKQNRTVNTTPSQKKR